MSDNRFVKAVDMLCDPQIGHVVSIFRLSVNVIVTSFSVMTKAVEVLNAQIKSLKKFIYVSIFWSNLN